MKNLITLALYGAATLTLGFGIGVQAEHRLADTGGLAVALGVPAKYTTEPKSLNTAPMQSDITYWEMSVRVIDDPQEKVTMEDGLYRERVIGIHDTREQCIHSLSAFQRVYGAPTIEDTGDPYVTCAPIKIIPPEHSSDGKDAHGEDTPITIEAVRPGLHDA